MPRIRYGIPSPITITNGVIARPRNSDHAVTSTVNHRTPSGPPESRKMTSAPARLLNSSDFMCRTSHSRAEAHIRRAGVFDRGLTSTAFLVLDELAHPIVQAP